MPAPNGRFGGRSLRRILGFGIAGAVLIASGAASAESGAKALPGATVDDLLALVGNFNPEVAAAALDREAAVAKIYPAGAVEEPTGDLAARQGFTQQALPV